MKWLLVALLALPSAGACSIAYLPFDQATWDGDLRYVQGTEVHRVRGNVDEVVADGWFVSYATVGDLLLVGGQTGLGAGCEGEGWLRLERAGKVVWEKQGLGRVFPHKDGPIVVHDDKAWRLVGEQLVALAAKVPAETYVLGWTHDSKPVYQNGGLLRVGDVELSMGGWPDVAASPTATGIAYSEGNKATLVEVGSSSRTITWTISTDSGGATHVAWAGAWYVVSGGRAYHVAEKVTDLGVAAVAAGPRGNQGVIFTEDSYVLFDGTKAVQSAKRVENAWVPIPASNTPKAVDGSWAPAPVSTTTTATAQQPPKPAPVASLPMTLALVGLAAMLRRK